jgi:hypothetical protein
MAKKTKEEKMIVVNPRFSLSQELYGWHLHLSVGDIDLLHNAVFPDIDKAAAAIRVLQNFFDGLGRNNMYVEMTYTTSA